MRYGLFLFSLGFTAFLGCGQESVKMDGPDTVQDLTVLVDMSIPTMQPDFAALDLSALPDLVPPPDFLPPPDLLMPDLTDLPAPSCTIVNPAVVPTKGPSTGGTTISIFCSNLAFAGIDVKVGGVTCTNPRPNAGSTAVQCETPPLPGRHALVDVVVTNRDGKAATVMKAFLVFPGMIQFGAAKQYPTGATGSVSAALADVDGDAKVDVITANVQDNTFSVLNGVGDGTFKAPTTYSTGLAPVMTVAADFNNDKFTDIASVDYRSDQVGIYLNNGRGVLQAPILLSFPANSRTGSLAVADLNADGNLDLVTGNKATKSLGITLGSGVVNGKPTYQPTTYVNMLMSGLGASSIVVGKFDSGPTLDVAVGFATSLGPPPALGFFSGKGDGTFAPEQSIQINGRTSNFIVSGNLDGAGPDDIVSTNNGNDSFVQLGTPQGPSAAGKAYAAGLGVNAIFVYDVNLDGIMDLITSNSVSSDVSVLLGVGDGSFALPLNIPTLTSPFWVGSADMNQDGLPDIVVVSNLSATIGVALSNAQ